MKLYDIARKEGGTWVRVKEDTDGPPSSPGFKNGDVVLFYHVDGTYSLCKNRHGNMVHLKAWTEVELVKEGEVT